MHGDHDALPVVASNGDSSLFVAATLAALVLAGSALAYRQTYQQQPQRGKLTQPSDQFTPDDVDAEKHQPLDAHSYSTGASSSTHDPDSKEFKSSRSKDRRRRGKDPLKEILKGGKNIKSTATTPVKQSFSAKPILDDLDNRNNININPSAPASSFTTNGAASSFSCGSGKRAQQDDCLVNLPETSVGSTVHSRTTSEVSQSNTGSRIPDQPHPHQHAHERTASSPSISEDRVLTPSQSSSSSHNGTEDNTGISEERQARETHLPVPTPRNFSTIQNNNDFSEIPNHSTPSYASCASSATNTTTTSCVITPATSPSLSSSSSKSVLTSRPVGESAPDNPTAPKNNLLEPSHALDTDTKSRNIPRKQQLLPNPNPSKYKYKSKSNTNMSIPRECNNAGEAGSLSPSSSISAPVIASTPTSSSITAPAFPPDIAYRKPPRLQSKTLWSKNTKNDVSPSIPGSVSHPSLLSPTSASFDSALLSPSISSTLEKVPSRVSKVVEEGDMGESEEVEERDILYDSYTQLEFPTLNPTVSTSSSLASNGNIASSSAAGPSNSHQPTTPRRTQNSRRPPTPHSTASSTSGSGSGSAQQPPIQIPAVSTQTQLASLRGALEAARLREEKHKAEMERYTKELEVLKWENVNSKRGEVELQNHMRHLMHQLHMYMSLFASVSPTSQQQPLQQTQGPIVPELSNPGDGAVSGSGSGDGPTTTSSPGTPNVQSPGAAFIPGPPVPSSGLGLSSPASAIGVFPSPMPSIHAPSPYSPYPMPPPPLHPHAAMPSPHPMFAPQFYHMQQQILQFQQYQHQPHIQNQSQSPTIQAQQANLISMLHLPSSAAIPSYQPSAVSSSSSMVSRSRSSSRPGTESTGSLSPDLNGSPSPAPGAKRKTRKRTQTANGIGGRIGWDDATDGWVVGGVSIDEGDERGHESIHECEEHGDGEDGGEYNELVADAIFKRPESIGVRSGKKSKQALLEKERSRDRESKQLENEVLDVVGPSMEFKFPSLSDLGNMYNGGHNQSSSSSSPLVVSQAPEDLGPDVFDLQAVADRPPPQDTADIEVSMSQNGAEPDNRNENWSSLNAASSGPESEETPRREKSESNVTELLMDLNGEEEATNVP